MKRLAIVAALLLAACASGQRPRGPQFNTAQPGEVIAAELAFARLAQERGQWTAFRETATAEAEMFVPQRVNAQQWLRGRADPPVSVRWSPQAVWVSCDGSYAVTKGLWTGPNSSGTFATVWQRQERGGYKWVLDMSLTTEGALGDIDTVDARVADCENQPRRSVAVGGIDDAGAAADDRTGNSNDGTLSWSTLVWPSGARHLEVYMWKEGEMRQVLIARVPEPPATR